MFLFFIQSLIQQEGGERMGLGSRESDAASQAGRMLQYL